MKLLLIRHGTTGVNEEIQKPQDALSEKGKEQIEKLSVSLSRQFPSITRIFTSDYVRALESAQIISQWYKQEPIVRKELREINLWLSLPELRSLSEGKRSQINTSLSKANDRVKNLFDDLDYSSDATYCFVAHGNLIRAVLGGLLDIPLEVTIRIQVDNASFSIVEYDKNEGLFKLTALNNTAHLYQTYESLTDSL